MKTWLLAVLAAILVTSPALSGSAQTNGPSGKVTISYEFKRYSNAASNQLTVWIEDAGGKYIRALYISNYAGRRGGWKARP